MSYNKIKFNLMVVTVLFNNTAIFHAQIIMSDKQLKTADNSIGHFEMWKNFNKSPIR